MDRVIVAQQQQSLIHAASDQILMRGDAQPFFEDADQMLLGIAKAQTDILNGKRFFVMFHDVLQDGRNFFIRRIQIFPVFAIG